MCNCEVINYRGTGLLKQSSTAAEVYMSYIDFCKVVAVSPSKIIGRPYNRKASKYKHLFIGVMLCKLKDKLPKGYEKELSRVLFIPYQNMSGLLYRTNLYLKTDTGFKFEVDDILSKIDNKQIN